MVFSVDDYITGGADCVVQADALSVKVGFPLSPDTRSAQSIANYYRLVNIDKTLYFDSLLSAEYVDALAKIVFLTNTDVMCMTA